MTGRGEPAGVWRVVAAREIATQLRSRAFQISAGILVLALIGLVVALTLTSGRETTHDIAVIDPQGLAAVEMGDAIISSLGSDDHLDAASYDSIEAAEAAVREGDVDAALLPGDDGFEIVGDNEIDGVVGQALDAAVARLITTQNAEQQGVDLDALSAGTQVGERLLDPGPGDAGLRQIASFVFVLLFYLVALGFGMQIAATVTQEKESRVVEILAAAVPIRALLWGKVVGTSVLAVGQMVLLALVGVVALVATDNTHALEVVGPAIGWFVLFFVLGFVALAGLWSVAGSLAGRQQDLQGTTAPLQLILFAPYILAVTAGEGVKTVVSMVPIVSTMMMPSRIAEGDVPWWQPVVAIGLTVLAAALLVRLAAQVYERTLLQTGRRIGLREAFASRAAE